MHTYPSAPPALEQNGLITGAPPLILVDDDEINLMSMQRALAKLSLVLEVYTARDGLAACNVMEQRAELTGGVLPPCYVILDLHMPRMNGLEFIDAVRSRPEWANMRIFLASSVDPGNGAIPVEDDLVVGHMIKDHSGQAFRSVLQRAGYLKACHQS